MCKLAETQKSSYDECLIHNDLNYLSKILDNDVGGFELTENDYRLLLLLKNKWKNSNTTVNKT